MKLIVFENLLCICDDESVIKYTNILVTMFYVTNILY